MSWRTSFVGYILCTWGCSAVAHAAPSAELEVVGQLSVHTEAEPTAEGHQIIRGKLTDEVGQAVGGTLSVLNPSGSPANIQVCPWLSPELAPPPRTQLETPGTVPVGTDGSFCFVAEEQKGLVLRAEADHFVKAVHDLDLGLQRALTRPRFVQAPVTIDLHLDESYVVQLLARSERQPPKGAQLDLSLDCGSRHGLGVRLLEDSRLQRFEFRPPKGIGPGNCKLVATATSADHKPLSATRSVLLRDQISLSLASHKAESDVFTLQIRAKGSNKGPQKRVLNEGLVEARQGGAFVGLGPVRSGVATLEFEMAQSPREIELTYVAASAAYLPGDGIIATVPSQATGFRWAGAHTLGLLCFCLWLGYAWLRPRQGKRRTTVLVPPKRTLLHESGKKTGPISGRVLDAHTGEPLGGMLLHLSAVGAETNEILEEVVTSDSGHFQMKTALESHPLLKLAVRGDDYMSLSSPTRGTQLTVHLTHRRRALVQGLVAWARQAGRPWDRKPAPTPRTVEKTALERGDSAKAEWARRVTEAAYGPSAPSEAATLSLRGPDLPPPASHRTLPGR